MIKVAGNRLLTAAALMAMALHAGVAAPQEGALDGQQPWAEVQAQIEALQQVAAEHGVEISDIQIRRNLEGSVTQDQPAFGCTVSQYRRIAEIPGEVRVEATAPSCIEAWKLLEEV